MSTTSAHQPDHEDLLERPIDVPLGSTAGSVGLAFFLAMLTGVVDAGVFLRAGVLPSVMTANTVFVGMWAVMGQWQTVALCLTAVVTFAVGSIIVVRIVSEVVDDGTSVRVRLARAEFAALVVLAILGTADRFGWPPLPADIYTYGIVISATLAMALQIPQVRKVEGVSMSTLFVTSAVAGLAYDIADRGDGPVTRRHERLYVALISAYLVGGAVGGALHLVLPKLGFVVPVVIFGAGWAWAEWSRMRGL